MQKRYKTGIARSTSALIRAAEFDPPNWEDVSAYLKRGADPDAELTINNYKVKLILHACSNYEYGVVTELVKKGAQVDCRITDPTSVHYGCTPIWFAARAASWRLFDLIKSKSIASIDLECKSNKYKGTTALWWCAFANEIKLVQDLLDLGANPNIWGVYLAERKVFEGNLALMLALIPAYYYAENRTKWDMILDVLAKHGDVYETLPDKYKKSYDNLILSWAIKDFKLDVAITLCNKNTISNFPESKIALLFLLVEQVLSPNAFTGDIDYFKKLILILLGEYDIHTIRNDAGDSLLHHVLANGTLQMVNFLIANWPHLMQEKNALQQNCLFASMNSDYSNLGLLFSHANLDPNELDIYGNSILYYATQKENEPDIRLLLDKGAKCIRNYIEIKFRLHFVAEFLSLNHEISLGDINVKDENLRTPLHFSILNGRDFLTEFLLKNGARSDLQDRYGYSPYHYAILKGKIAYLQLMQNIAPNQKNNLGVSAYTMACYKNNQEVKDFILSNSSYVKTEVDQALAEKLDAQIIKFEWLPRLKTLEESLIFLAAMKNQHDRKLGARAILNYIANSIFTKFFPKIDHSYPKGRAFGIELEFAHMPDFPLIPINNLLELFNISAHYDGSVEIPTFMKTMVDAQELVSEIIDSPIKMQKFLTACKYLHESGAKVNASTGFHVHVNINGGGDVGYIDDCLNLLPKEREAVRLNIVKQILLNWAQIEPMLCGILRNGRHFAQGVDYVAIQPCIKDILACNNIEDLQLLFNRRSVSQTVSVLSLNSGFNTFRTKHGTLEFRFHQGTSDPILITAWLNLIARLVDLSVQQIKTGIQLDRKNYELKPYPGIEHLVYMLLAERRYQDTWDNNWGAPHCNYDYAADTDIQHKIQISPLYLAYQAKTQGEKTVFQLDPYAEKDLATMLQLRNKSMGISCN